MSLYLRDLPGRTLGQIADEMNTDEVRWDGVTTEMNIRLDGEQMYFQFGETETEVPVTRDGVEQIGAFVDIPTAYLLRIPADEQRFNLVNRLRRNPQNVSVRYTEGGIHEVHSPNGLRIEPRQITESAIKVMGESAEVVQWHVSPDEFGLDVMVPEGFDRGIGGDPQVNDISRGGLRFFQDRKHNRAPAVNTFLYRLVCTNGMVVPESGTAVDARGLSVTQVLAELELAAQRAFGQVEEQIEHFYAMRQQQIEGDVTQAVLRVARERGLPRRTAMTLAERVPTELDPEVLGHPVSMFDLANLMTNEANNPALRSSSTRRRVLELAGGSLVQEAHDRCHNCQQVIA